MSSEETGTNPQTNWRDPSSYDYARTMRREDWAREFLRRSSADADLAATPQRRRRTARGKDRRSR
jgi:hypothetical protein